MKEHKEQGKGCHSVYSIKLFLQKFWEIWVTCSVVRSVCDPAKPLREEVLSNEMVPARLKEEV